MLLVITSSLVKTFSEVPRRRKDSKSSFRLTDTLGYSLPTV